MYENDPHIVYWLDVIKHGWVEKKTHQKSKFYSWEHHPLIVKFMVGIKAIPKGGIQYEFIYLDTCPVPQKVGQHLFWNGSKTYSKTHTVPYLSGWTSMNASYFRVNSRHGIPWGLRKHLKSVFPYIHHKIRIVISCPCKYRVNSFQITL